MRLGKDRLAGHGYACCRGSRQPKPVGRGGVQQVGRGFAFSECRRADIMRLPVLHRSSGQICGLGDSSPSAQRQNNPARHVLASMAGFFLGGVWAAGGFDA